MFYFVEPSSIANQKGLEMWERLPCICDAMRIFMYDEVIFLSSYKTILSMHFPFDKQVKYHGHKKFSVKFQSAFKKTFFARTVNNSFFESQPPHNNHARTNIFIYSLVQLHIFYGFIYILLWCGKEIRYPSTGKRYFTNLVIEAIIYVSLISALLNENDFLSQTNMHTCTYVTFTSWLFVHTCWTLNAYMYSHESFCTPSPSLAMTSRICTAWYLLSVRHRILDSFRNRERVRGRAEI